MSTLAEVFGYSVRDVSAPAVAARSLKHCRFKNAPCNKAAEGGGALGVCSIETNGKVEVVCPSRFLEKDVVSKALTPFFFPSGKEVSKSQKVLFVPEVRFTTSSEKGSKLGNVDWTAVCVENDAVLKYAPMEFQAVYTSGGGVQKSFDAFIKTGLNLPAAFSPDYRSSGRKRLLPQLISKGGPFAAAGLKQAVVLSGVLFEKEFLPFLTLTKTSKEEADFAWLCMCVDKDSKLIVKTVFYTTYLKMMPALLSQAKADLPAFEKALMRRLSALE